MIKYGLSLQEKQKLMRRQNIMKTMTLDEVKNPPPLTEERLNENEYPDSNNR